MTTYSDEPIDQADYWREKCVGLEARLVEEVENAATYKQERDEICVNYETVAAKLSEAHRQNADLMAIIDKRDEALGFIPLDKGMDMQDELREVKARLAEAEHLILRMAGEDYQRARFYVEKYDLTGERAAAQETGVNHE